MSSIPYNYGSYIDAKVAMTDTGHVSAGKQIQSPASAGSRGLAKTTQFTNDRTQMQMGNSPIAESMVEIRNILNRIDGVNAPVQEDAGEKIANMAQNMTKDQFMSHADELGLTPEEAAEHYEKMQGRCTRAGKTITIHHRQSRCGIHNGKQRQDHPTTVRWWRTKCA